MSAWSALLLLAAAPAPLPLPDAPVIVAVSGVESTQGVVRVDLCPEAEFLRADCRWSGVAPAVAGTTFVIVPHVPPGRYAAQGYHDLNDNSRVDRNFLGLPTERVGFSNDAAVRFAPPRFAAAAFDHGAVAQHIGFRVHRIP